jgi:hypothetical protein
VTTVVEAALPTINVGKGAPLLLALKPVAPLYAASIV